MTKKFEEIFEEAKKVSLKPEERFSIYSYLSSFIEKTDVSSDELIRHKYTHKPETAGSINPIRFLFKPMPLILIIALIVGGGVTVAAENALPGDVLFPVKVNINENVMTLLAFTDEAKVNIDAKKAERRLEEAGKLAAEGRLDADTRAKIEDNFEKFADRVETRIEKLQEQGKAKAALEATSNFEAALQAHQAILDRLAELKTDSSIQIVPIRVKVELKLKAVKEQKEEFETKEMEIKKEREVDEAYRKKLKEIEECGLPPGAPGQWVCKDGRWQLLQVPTPNQ